MHKRNCVTSLICAAIFAFFLYQCSLLSESAAYWPRMICIVGLVLCAIEVVTEGMRWSREDTETQGKLWVLSAAQTKRGALLLGILLLWIIGLDTLGFLVSSLIALCVTAVCFEPHRTKKNLLRDVVTCAVIGVAIYFLFGYLGVHFPRALMI